IFERKLEVEGRDISKLKELLSDKESNYRVARRKIDELTLELEQVKTQLSKTSVGCEKYDYSSKLLENMVCIQYQEKRGKGLCDKECEPPFNHNYSSMPRINTSVDDLVLQSEHAFEFPTEPVSLIIVLSVIGLREKEKERIDGRSTYCSTSSNKSHFVPNTNFVGKFVTINIKPNEIFKCFKTTFVKIDDDVLEYDSSPLKHVNSAHSTITKEADSKLYPNCEPYVPTGSLEQASTSTSPGQVRNFKK
ncbi:hypothetical protein R6Q57_011456, partial [Mikania cordata]